MKTEGRQRVSYVAMLGKRMPGRGKWPCKDSTEGRNQIFEKE